MATQQLRFTRWDTPAAVAGSALFTESLGCGIYVLEFANGDEHVGQSVNFPVRFATHRRRWDDIVAVRFAPVLAHDLNASELEMVRARQAAGKLLRNINLLSQPIGPSALDLTVDTEVQAAWLSAEVEDAIIEIGDRPALAERRIKSRKSFEQLRVHPLYEEVVEALAVYVALVIPWPHTTEGRLWTLTALPSTNRRRDHRRLATLSIQNVEVLVLAESLEAGGSWSAFTLINTAVADSLPPELARLVDVIHDYRSAGPVHHYALGGLEVAADLLFVPEVLKAARHLALGQLRKGRAAFSRFHNDPFTDEIFIKMSDLLAPVDDAKSPGQPVG